MVKEYVKNYSEQMKEIQKNLSEIVSIVNKLPESASFTKSLKTTLENFQKKMDGFLATGTELTEEQKNAIRAIKSGKANSETLSALSSLMETKKGSGSNDNEQTEKPPKAVKKGKKN